MEHTLFLILALLLAVSFLVMLADRIRIAYPVFLVIAGLAISFIPGIPRLSLNPRLIFLIFLPPLLYEAAWYTSWNTFWKWRRAIVLLAFGLVFFTSMVVAYVSEALIPGFTLSLGFLLGGIVSPPDAVAAASILKGVKAPKRIMAILEGESLINDASSLIVFRFALAAALTQTFSMDRAIGQFFLVSGMGIVVGLAGANIMYVIHRFLPTSPPIDAALTVMTPYLLFLSAEEFHFSGIMAVVSGGLFLSWRSHEVFQTGSTRINMLGVWTTLIFVMNALVFVLIGLSLPQIIQELGSYSIGDAITYGLIISGTIIAVRFLWVFPSAHIPRWVSRKARKDPSPGWKGPLVVAWAGMRGVVSLATALSIPALMTDGSAFPQRSLILFITFIVIFVTLVVQGLSLPLVIRLIKIKEIDKLISEEEERTGIRLRLDKAALRLLEEKYASSAEKYELIGRYKSSLEKETEDTQEKLSALERHETKRAELALYHRILMEIYGLQRKELFQLKKEKIYSDEEIRKAQLQIDIDELKISNNVRH